MKALSKQLQKIINEQILPLSKIPAEAYTRKTNPTTWSKKEIVGHIIDSAQNNIQRFIRAQYEVEPSINYDPDFWVKLNNYQKADIHNLLKLLQLLNEQIVMIWENIPEEDLNRKCFSGQDKVTIKWLMEDYMVHIQHHLLQLTKP
jgi:hypothetical protein